MIWVFSDCYVGVSTKKQKCLLPLSVNKDACHQWLRAPAATWWAPRELRKERIPAISSQQTAATPHGEPWTTWWMWKHRILVPESWGTWAQERCQRARLLHLSIHGKSTKLKSLNLDYLVSFNLQENFWHWRLPPFVAKLLYSLALTSASSGSLEVLPQGPKS